jgi:hypothetical protein
VSDVQAGTNRVAVQAATGQTYGKATEQMNAQRAVPMGASPTETQVQRPMPGAVVDFAGKSQRPLEPVTAGAPFGAGPGPAVMGQPITSAPAQGSRQDLIERVRAIASTYPNPNLFSLMRVLESE